METNPNHANELFYQPLHVVSPEEWLEERRRLLAKEKELTRLTDEINEERRKLPWVKVKKNYIFEGPGGKETLADLFDGRSQLIIKHFMLGPGWKEGCVGCSFGADHLDGANVHLQHHDVTLVAVSRAPYPEIKAFKNRMGWKFRWVSSYENDFNFDFYVSFTQEQLARGKVFYNYKMQRPHGEEMSGLSIFYKDEAGNVYHTYSTYARGDEKAVGAYMLLDLTPKGRNENGPHFNLADWVRHHDRYDDRGYVESTGRYVSLRKDGSCCNQEGGHHEK